MNVSIGPRLLLGGAVILVASALVAGAQAAGTAVPDLAYANAQADRFGDVPSFTAPGPAFAAAKASGKTVFVIPATPEANTLPSIAGMVGGIRQAAKAAGVKVWSCTNTGAAASWTACFNQAIKKKVGLIAVAGGGIPSAASSELAVAKAAGIPVIASHVAVPGDFPSGQASSYQAPLAGLTAVVPAPYGLAATLLADYVIADRNGSGNFLIVSSSDLAPSAGMLANVQSEFSTVCGSACSVNVLDIPYADWQTKATSMIKTAVLAKTINYVIPLFDGIDDILAQGIADARASNVNVNRPSICSFGGQPWAIQQGQDNNRVECDIAENMNWFGWATMDQALRVLTGHKPVATENTSVRIWSDDNWATEDGGLEDAGFPPTIDSGWGDPAATYIAGYEKLWQLPVAKGATAAASDN